jgi:molybdenum cofactor cytidylyltransferase
VATGRGDVAADGALEAIVLAAGAGARFGGAKLTAPWAGGRLIDGALAAAFAAPARTVIVVTGADPMVAQAARDWAATRDQLPRLHIVHTPDHAEGMGASLRAGVRALPADCEGVFVLLGDMPRIPVGVLRPLAAALAEGAPAAAPAFAGRRGHPVLFGASLFPALAQSRGDEGARTVLSGLGPDLRLVDCADPGVLQDVDSPDDLRRL